MTATLQQAVASGALSRKSHPGRPSAAHLCQECAIEAQVALTDDARLLTNAARALDHLEAGRERVRKAALSGELDELTANRVIESYDRTAREIEATLFKRACHICGKVIPEIKAIVAKVAA